jgi:hypothetical protein
MPVRLPNGVKPSKVVGRDSTRPELTQAVLLQQDDTWVLMATDSYRFLRLSVEADEGEQPGPISRKAMKAAEKTGCFAAGEHIEPLDKNGEPNGGMLFRRPDELAPKWSRHWDSLCPAEPSDKDKLTLGLDARFLFEIAQALGTEVVQIEIDLAQVTNGTYLKPYVIKGAGGPSAGQALLMPVRVNL